MPAFQGEPLPKPGACTDGNSLNQPINPAMKPKMFSLAFVLAACVAGLLSPALHAQERRTDDSTGVQPLRGAPQIPYDYMPAQTASNNGTIPFVYGMYGSVGSGNAGVASYFRTGNTVLVSVSGASGRAVNQSAPTLFDNAGRMYYPSSTNCRVGMNSCSSSYNIVAGSSPARLNVYWQGADDW